MAVLITTTGTTGTITIPELGNFNIQHPSVELDLEGFFSIEEIRDSETLQTSLSNGEIIIIDNFGRQVTDLKDLDDNQGLANVLSIDNIANTDINMNEHSLLNVKEIDVDDFTLDGYEFITGGFAANRILTVNSLNDGIISSDYIFNDSGTGINDIWSADRVIDYVSNLSTTGITSLNGLTNTTQNLSSNNDANVQLSISSVTDTHTFSLSWNGLLAIDRGGTNNNTFETNEIIIYDDVNDSLQSSGFVFNDNGTSVTDIWSADKIIDYTDNISLTLAEVLASGNIADRNIDMDDNSIENIESLEFTLHETLLSGHQPGRMYWDANDSTISVDMEDEEVVLKLGQKQFYKVRNESGNTIAKGTVVSFAGTLGSSNKILIQNAIGDGTIPAQFVMGIATHDIVNNEEGYITSFGFVKDFDTTGEDYNETWANGDILYLSPNILGGLTKFKPTAPNPAVQIAAVVFADENGSIFIRPTFFGRLEDVDDVEISTPIVTDSIIQFDGTRWVNVENPSFNDVSINSLTLDDYLFDTNSFSSNEIVRINSSNDEIESSGYIFNDSGTGTSDIWSADKIIDYVGDITGGTGILSLNGLTSGVQLFDTDDDTNVKININSATNTHTFDISWDGLLSIDRGGLNNNIFENEELLTYDSNSDSIVSTGYKLNDLGESDSDIWSAERIIEEYGAPGSYAGVIEENGGFTDNNDGTITLPTVHIGLYDNPDYKGVVRSYTVEGGTTGIELDSLVNDATNHILIDYNSGSPEWVISTTDSSNGSDIITYLRVFRFNDILHVLEYGETGSGLPNRISERFKAVERYARESGFVLSLSSGIVNLTSGVAWNITDRQELPSVNSDTADFFKNYKVGGDWQVDFTASGGRVNNEFYNDGTDRITATPGKFIVNWYYRGQEVEPHLYEVYGSGEYDNVLEAQLESESGIPELISSHAFLVGRIIIEVGEDEGIAESAFTQRFSTTTVPNHNDLNNLQGGAANEYYHLTESEYADNALKTDSMSFNSNVVAGTLTTTATTDTLLTGMQFTDVLTGTYFLNFGTSLTHGSNAESIFISVYVNGTQVSGSEREWRRGNQQGDIAATTDLAGFPITLTETSTVEIRWRTTTGTATSTNRHISLLRVDRLSV